MNEIQRDNEKKKQTGYTFVTFYHSLKKIVNIVTKVLLQYLLVLNISIYTFYVIIIFWDAGQYYLQHIKSKPIAVNATSQKYIIVIL